MEALDFQKDELENIIEDIREKAAIYTPEWEFTPEHPDMGTVLALLFADMMKETVKQYRQLPERYRKYFYNLSGAKLLPATEAKGYVTFSTVNEEVSGSLVPAGTKVSGESDGDRVLFETREEVYVSPARLEQIYYVNGKRDYISNPFTFPIDSKQLENQQSHIFYIGHSTLFSIRTEGEIVLDFHFLPNVHGKEMEMLFMNEISWSYSSREGFVEFSMIRYEEGRVYLYKDKTMPAFERTEIQGKSSCWIRMEMQYVKPETQIRICKMSLMTEGIYLMPETIYDGNVELEKECFKPFGEQPYPYAEVYLLSDEVFSKKGAAIKISFDLEFLKCPGEMKSPEIPIQWRNIMHRSELEKKEPKDIRICSVVWEYYNGVGWLKIPGTKCYQELFSNEKDSGKVNVEFDCPKDIYPFMVAGKDSHCIRIRIVKIENFNVVDGIYLIPQMKNLTMYYTYQKAEIFPEYACSVNQMLKNEWKCNQEWIPFYNVFPNKEMLYFSFSVPLNEAEIRILFTLEKGKQRANARYRYEYYGENGWSILNVEDGTRHLSRTGILTLSKPHSFVKQRFFASEGYWIRLIRECDEMEEAKIQLPPISGIYINSTAVLAQKESGKSGNLPAGAVHTMERSIGFIDKVTNYKAMMGGCDAENSEQSVKRNAAYLRHQGRAVTVKDFEDIIAGKMRNIEKVQCFSGRNEKGEQAPGHITLVVLPEKESDFEGMKEEIYHCLMPHMDSRLYEEGRIHIVEPEWYQIKVYMKLFADASVGKYQLKEKIIQRINAFVDPVTGNFDGKGWKVGKLPSAIQIQNACSHMEEILYIKQLSLKEESRTGIYALGIGEEHEIEIISE